MTAMETFVDYEVIKKYVPKNPVIIEAGACRGEDVGWKCGLWPEGRVYAFEPVPELFESLKQLTSSYENLKVYQNALAETTGYRAMWVADGASSILKPIDSFNDNYFHCDMNHPISVKCYSFKDWMEMEGLDHIDFFWLDAEGAEMLILSSIPSHVVKKCSSIFIEASFTKKWHNSVLYHDLALFFKRHGFREVWSQSTPGWGGNFLFVNKELYPNIKN